MFFKTENIHRFKCYFSGTLRSVKNAELPINLTGQNLSNVAIADYMNASVHRYFCLWSVLHGLSVYFLNVFIIPQSYQNCEKSNLKVSDNIWQTFEYILRKYGAISKHRHAKDGHLKKRFTYKCYKEIAEWVPVLEQRKSENL